MVIPSFHVLFCGWAEGTSVITGPKHNIKLRVCLKYHLLIALSPSLQLAFYPNLKLMQQLIWPVRVTKSKVAWPYQKQQLTSNFHIVILHPSLYRSVEVGFIALEDLRANNLREISCVKFSECITIFIHVPKTLVPLVWPSFTKWSVRVLYGGNLFSL